MAKLLCFIVIFAVSDVVPALRVAPQKIETPTQTQKYDEKTQTPLEILQTQETQKTPLEKKYDLENLEIMSLIFRGFLDEDFGDIEDEDEGFLANGDLIFRDLNDNIIFIKGSKDGDIKEIKIKDEDEDNKKDNILIFEDVKDEKDNILIFEDVKKKDNIFIEIADIVETDTESAAFADISDVSAARKSQLSEKELLGSTEISPERSLRSKWSGARSLESKRQSSVIQEISPAGLEDIREEAQHVSVD